MNSASYGGPGLDAMSRPATRKGKGMNIRRRLTLLAMVSAFMLFVAGCAPSGEQAESTATTAASSGETPDATTQPSGDPTDLTLTTWSSSEAIFELWQQLAAEFREDNPDMGELIIQSIPVDEYLAQTAIQLTGGDPPDLGFIRNFWIGPWLDAEILYDIQELKSVPEFQWDEVLPSLSACCEGENGELWAYPSVNTVYPVYYNESAFEAAGVDTPKELYERDEWTWQNLRRIAKEMVDAGVVTYGLDIAQYSFVGLPQFVDRGFGAVYWPDATSCGLTDPATVEAIQFFHDMIFVDGTYPTPGTKPNFGSGDTAMSMEPPSSMANFAEAEFEWDIAPQPSGDGVYDPQLSQATLGVYAKSGSKELATRFLAYMMSPHGADVQAKVFIPARSGDLARAQELMVEENPEVSHDSIQAALIDTLAVATPDPVVERLPEIRTATNPILDSLWEEGADIAAVLADACDAAAPFLTEG